MKTKQTLLLGLALFLCLTLQAQVERHLTYRRYTTQDGLPQMQAERLWQDSRGYIYIGTLSGFVRFDGKTFTPFLKGHRFNIVEFAEINGTVRAFDFRRQWTIDYDDVKMKPIDPQRRWLLNNFNGTSLPNGYFVLEDEHEENRRLCHLTGEKFSVVTQGEVFDWMTPDRKLYLDSTTIYVPTERGLYRVRQHKAMRLTSKSDIYTVHRATYGMLAFASDGIYSIGNKLKMKTRFDFTSTNYGLIVRDLGDGCLLLADEHTLYEYDGNNVKEIATGFNLIKDVLVDRWGRLWVATYQGLYCYFKRNFTCCRLNDHNDIVRAIGIGADDRVIMGTLNGKLIENRKERKAERREGTDYFTVVEDNPNNFYAPNAVTIGDNVYMAGNGDVLSYDGTTHWMHLPHDRYLFVAKAGERLIAGSKKCIIAVDLKDGAIDTLTTSVPHPWCAAEDSQGKLWVGTTFGLFADGVKKEYRQQLIVTSMERDAQGNIIFSSKDSLFLIRKGEIEPLQMPSLAGHEVRSLHVSPKGYLIVAAIDGLLVGRISKEYAISDVQFFDHTNGFTALEPLMATMAEASDGTIWLAGIEEMTSFRPEDLLSMTEEDTYITPPLKWWQHLWVWLAGLLLLSLTVWTVTRWYEKRRSRLKMIHLQREKLQREEQINAIRKKAIEEVNGKTDNPGEANVNALAKDIVKMTEKAFEERLTLRTASGIIVIDVKDIAYFKGDGNYSQIVTFHDKDTVLLGLGALEKILNPNIFVRADRSTLVNIHHICSLLPKQHRCIFRSPTGLEVETTLLAPAFKRLQKLL